MEYLSPQIAALTKSKAKKSLVNPPNSCGIFQDYGTDGAKYQVENPKKD